MAFYSLLFLFFFIHFCWASTEAAAPTYLDRDCATDKTYIGDFGYRMNLKHLLSFLSSNATGKTEFYNTTVATNPSDTAYGLFMCSGDVTPQLCHQCVRDAIDRLSMDHCSYSKEAVFFYVECLVRYSNHSFFSTVGTSYKYTKSNSADVFDLLVFERSFFNTVSATVNEAANPALGEKKYAKKQVNLSSSRYKNLLCVAQCTPDLWPQDCRSCLGEVTRNLQIDGRSALVIYPSCYFRYEFLLSSPTPTNTSDTRGKENIYDIKMLIIILSCHNSNYKKHWYITFLGLRRKKVKWNFCFFLFVILL